MIRSAIAAAAFGLALLAPAGLAPATSAAKEREVARLDAPVVLKGGPRPVTHRLRFTLPEGARQGPEQWYVVRLHYRLRFARNSGRGLAWVTSATNDLTSAQIEYTADQRSVRRSTVDLTHGQRDRRLRSPTDELTFTNYVQYAGVRGGTNTWTIGLEQAGGARVERVEVLGDSAIVRTDRTPFPPKDGDKPRAGGIPAGEDGGPSAVVLALALAPAAAAAAWLVLTRRRRRQRATRLRLRA